MPALGVSQSGTTLLASPARKATRVRGAGAAIDLCLVGVFRAGPANATDNSEKGESERTER
jgi:hypothetical protein